MKTNRIIIAILVIIAAIVVYGKMNKKVPQDPASPIELDKDSYDALDGIKRGSEKIRSRRKSRNRRVRKAPDAFEGFDEE